MNTIARYHLSIKTGNKKLGYAATSTSPKSTCPDKCPLKKTGKCYGDQGPISWFWGKVDKGLLGDTWEVFLEKVKKLPAFLPYRHDQIGDLPGDNNTLDVFMFTQLRQAVRHLAVKWTYTHKPLTKKAERQAIAESNAEGFIVNLSGNNLNHADSLYDLNIGPVVTIVPNFESMPKTTPKGRRLVPCPEQTDGITCDKCQLCAKPRKAIVAFAAHARLKASDVALYQTQADSHV